MLKSYLSYFDEKENDIVYIVIVIEVYTILKIEIYKEV